MILPLARKGHSVWKQKFENIHQITPEIKRLVRDMKETLEITSGVGLAAPQVGAPLQLFIASYGRLKDTFINPKITKYGRETDELEEGCLSIPCTRGIVKRPSEVEVEYTDLKGRGKKLLLSGYYARIVQHEYDHLSSIFYRNRIPNKRKVYTYKPIKIVFFGTSEFGVPILKGLIGQTFIGDYSVSLVVTRPDKPSSRGLQMVSSPVKQLAVSFEIPTATPTNLKEKRFISELTEAAPDFIVLAAYGQIIPKQILEISKKAPINVHPSLLPKYRGPSPVQAAIANGDTHTGVTIIKMDERADEGDILAAAKTRIGNSDTAKSLSDRLSKIGLRLTNQVLHLESVGKIKPIPQDPKQATYTRLLTKKDGYIDWQKPPENLERLVRAYYPWPGVWTYYQGSGIWDGSLRTLRPQSGLQGSGKRILKLLPNRMVQLEGKNPVSLKEFKAGHPKFKLEW